MNELPVLIGLGLAALVLIVLVIALAQLYSDRKRAELYAEESRKLMQLLTDGKIDQETYERLRMRLEEKKPKTTKFWE